MSFHPALYPIRYRNPLRPMGKLHATVLTHKALEVAVAGYSTRERKTICRSRRASLFTFFLRYFKSVPQPELAPVPHCLPKSPDRPRPGVDARDQGPLTLSQLSPRKGSEGVLSTQAVPPSPMRTSMKRPISPSLHSIEARDMGKPADKISNERRSKRIKTLQLSLARNVVEPNASSQRLTRAPPAARNFTQQGRRTSLRKDRSASTSSRTLHVSGSSDARRSRAADKRRDENSSSISRPGPATKSSRPVSQCASCVFINLMESF